MMKEDTGEETCSGLELKGSVKHSTLIMDLRPGEVITLGREAKIHFVGKSGRVMRVMIVAPVGLKISK